jgi:ribose transport system permease protein
MTHVTRSPSAEKAEAPPSRGPIFRLSTRRLGLRSASAVYIWLGLITLFGILTPATFLTWTNARSVLDGQAVTGLLAIGLVVPLAAGEFDLSVGYTLALGSILSAWLLGKGVAVAPAIALTIIAGVLVGILNGLLVTRAKIDSFIATLGVGSILAGMVSWVSGDQTLIGLPAQFQAIATRQLLGLQLPFFYMIVAALVLGVVLEHTPLGRYVYATGGNREAARLAGLPTQRLAFGAFVIAGALAAFAGLILSSQTAAGSPDIGPTYLLPGFAAAFLGSTQLKVGRFNVWGTLLAVYVLATGIKGLQLLGAPFWIPDVFNGVALVLTVGLAKTSRRRVVSGWSRSVRWSRRGSQALPVSSAMASPVDEVR